MKHRLIFIVALAGLLAGLLAAWFFGIERKAQPPAFAPVSSPYASAIYADGIVESDQDGGTGIQLYPEVSGVVKTVLVHEGQAVTAGTPLVALDDSVQSAATEQLRLQALAAQSLLQELTAEPRRESLEVARAQVEQAEANLKTAQDQFDKRRASHEIDPRSISQDALDTAADAAAQARAARDVAMRQYQLVQAGAWSYDIANQRHQADALQQAYLASRALLAKYVVRAQSDGVVLAVNAGRGSTVTPQGAYDAYTQAQDPLVVMSTPQTTLAVRCFIDEILVSRLPDAAHIQAQMSLRGTDTKVPLDFVRVQPWMSPKIELSNQRQERVDLRVLPVIFRFHPGRANLVYPGQLVDVYIGRK